MSFGKNVWSSATKCEILVLFSLILLLAFTSAQITSQGYQSLYCSWYCNSTCFCSNESYTASQPPVVQQRPHRHHKDKEEE